MMARSTWLLCSCMVLAGCGGGGSGGSSIPVVGGGTASATPTPTPAPASTPTPAPTGRTLLNLASDTRLEGFAGSNGYFRAGDGEVTGVQDLDVAAGTPVTYDASARTFTFTSFEYLLPNRADPAGVTLRYDAAASTPGYATYTGQANGVSYSFTQLTPGPTNPVLPLSYTSVAIAQASYLDASTGQTDHGVTPMAFGLLFDWDTTSLTGSGSYHGNILGQGRGKSSSHVYRITGTITLNIDYDTTDFSGQLHLLAEDDRTGARFDLGTLPLASVAPRHVLDYFYADVTRGGLLQGRLGGPHGEEFVAGFDANLPDPQAPGVMMKISGALAATR